jgi:hypothetical protein
MDLRQANEHQHQQEQAKATREDQHLCRHASPMLKQSVALDPSRTWRDRARCLYFFSVDSFSSGCQSGSTPALMHKRSHTAPGTALLPAS